MKKFKGFVSWVKELELKKIVKSNSFVVFSLLLFFPLGLYLLWKSPNFRKSVKLSMTVVGSFWMLITVVDGINLSAAKNEAHLHYSNYTEVMSEYEAIKVENRDLQESESAYQAYKKKMAPYESMSEADAKKKENDVNIAGKVTVELEKLPELAKFTLENKEMLTSIQSSFDKLSKEQQVLVDVSVLGEYETKVKELEKEAKEKAATEKKAAEVKAAEDKKAAEYKKKREAEEALGYETGITYDQLARTPDDYELKKVKFYGKVIQVLEADGSTQIRLVVDDNYDTVLYGEYLDSTVTSRVLEDDYITIYGHSTGLLSYDSTMGGTITIPSVFIDKIDQ